MTIKLSKQIGKNFCFAPWTNLHISIEGNYRTCCSGVDLGNIKKDLIIDVFASDQYKSIQIALANNQPHVNCRHCLHLEKNGGTSERTWYTHNDVEINTLHEQKYHSIDIRWNNVCDLSCTYCNKNFSSTWAKLQNTKHSSFYNKTNVDAVYDYISTHKEIKQINLAGGEPLLIKENLKLFDVINNTDTKLYIISNFASDIRTNQIFQKLMAISNDFQIDISFDTVGDKFEYVRHGGCWNTMLDNIHYAQEQITKYKPNSNISITSLYSVYNALELSQFTQHLYDHELPMPRWTWLYNPKPLDVLQLPNRFEEICLEELHRSMHIFPQQDTNFFTSMLESVKNNNSYNQDCDYLYKWHAQQEQTFWPSSPLKFADLWPNFR